MELTLDNILNDKNSLKLMTNQFVVVSNSKLKSLINIVWLYSDETLTITRISPEMEKEMKHIQPINDESFLVLNSEDKGYERVLLLTINIDKNNLDVEEVVQPQISQGKFKIHYN